MVEKTCSINVWFKNWCCQQENTWRVTLCMTPVTQPLHHTGRMKHYLVGYNNLKKLVSHIIDMNLVLAWTGNWNVPWSSVCAGTIGRIFYSTHVPQSAFVHNHHHRHNTTSLIKMTTPRLRPQAKEFTLGASISKTPQIVYILQLLWSENNWLMPSL